MLYRAIPNELKIIIDFKIENSSAQMLQIKVLITSFIDGSNIGELVMKKFMLDSIIEEIVIRKGDEVVIWFRTDITMEVILL